jgi:hypothetical protein
MKSGVTCGTESNSLVLIHCSKCKLGSDNEWQRPDLFIAHPVSKFVPDDVPSDILGLMPATTDWCDPYFTVLSELNLSSGMMGLTSIWLPGTLIIT